MSKWLGMSYFALATYVRRQYPRAIDSWMQSPLRQDKRICLDLKQTNKPLSVHKAFLWLLHFQRKWSHMKPPNILSDYLAIFSQHVAMLRKRCSLVESTIHYSPNGRLIAATIFTAILWAQWAVISGGSTRRIVFCDLKPSEYLSHCVSLLHFTTKFHSFPTWQKLM